MYWYYWLPPVLLEGRTAFTLFFLTCSRGLWLWLLVNEEGEGPSKTDLWNSCGLLQVVRSHHAAAGGVSGAGGAGGGGGVCFVSVFAADGPHVRAAGAQPRRAGVAREVSPAFRQRGSASHLVQQSGKGKKQSDGCFTYWYVLTSTRKNDSNACVVCLVSPAFYREFGFDFWIGSMRSDWLEWCIVDNTTIYLGFYTPRVYI